MSLHLPQQFRYAGRPSGVKTAANAKDLTIILSDIPAVAAGVYTQNAVVAAPVVQCREKTPLPDARAIVINSGNANACTGIRGSDDARRMSELVAESCGSQFSDRQTLVMSTGVIGQNLQMKKIEHGIRDAASNLSDSEEAFLDAADGILTTDIGRKIGSRTCQIEGRTVNIAAMAKGAGMIGPNMATMLCCVMSDVALQPAQAQRLLQVAADQSFNNISVEGHTSTNDTMLLFANGAAGGAPLSVTEEDVFSRELNSLCIELAKKIPADGEGATHLIEIVVRGAASDADARKISHTIASSNLVKTAIYGNDPNWGRIVSAAGYADAAVDTSMLQLTVNNILLFRDGEPVAFDEKKASLSLRDQPTTSIEMVVGKGPGTCTHWTSDLTVQYVRFNSEYTT